MSGPLYIVEVNQIKDTGLFRAVLRNTVTNWSEAHFGISEQSAHRIAKKWLSTIARPAGPEETQP